MAGDRRRGGHRRGAGVTAVRPVREDGGPPPEPRREERAEPGFVEEVSGSPVVRSFLPSAGSALGRETTRGLFGTHRRR